MNSPFLRASAVVTGAILFCGVNAPMAQGSSDGQAMQKIANDYDKLQQTAMNALQEKARNWKDEQSPSAGGAATKTSTVSLRTDGLLIAACSAGILAGAPNGDSSGSTGMTTDRPSTQRGGTGTDRPTDPGRPTDTDRPGGSDLGGLTGRDQQGQTVGMLLVVENGGSRSGQPRDAAGMRDREPTDVAGREPLGGTDRTDTDRSGGLGGTTTTGKLKPGAYCIKRSGTSVWLTDQNGQTVLRTSMHMPMGDKMGGHMQKGATDREPTGIDRTGGSDDLASGSGTSMRSSRDDKEWAHVFGAITEEVMTSMGWSKKS